MKSTCVAIPVRSRLAMFAGPAGADSVERDRDRVGGPAHSCGHGLDRESLPVAERHDIAPGGREGLNAATQGVREGAVVAGDHVEPLVEGVKEIRGEGLHDGRTGAEGGEGLPTGDGGDIGVE
jgi:hypothetical protein